MAARHVCVRTGLAAIAVAWAAAAAPAIAGPEGYAGAIGVTVTEATGTEDLVDYPVQVVLNTTDLVASGQLRADGADVVFALGGGGCGEQELPHWLERVDADTMTFWVRVPAVDAGQAISLLLFHGNPADDAAETTSAHAALVFADAQGPSDVAALHGYSSTQQVSSGSAGGVGNSQRGFRFTPNRDVLLTSLGKREPTGTTRYVTLFDATTQQILRQQQVGGPAADYAYAAVEPIWLRAGVGYIVEVFQASGDGYYFGTSSQIAPDLTYLDMRYCNGCTQDTFPTSALSNYHYGYPDFAYLRRATATIEPVVAFDEPVCTESMTCDSDCSTASCGDGVFNASAGEQCDDGNADDADACLTTCVAAACGDGFVFVGTEACDDGNVDDTDACPSTCEAATCGDGFVLAGTEACDDANADDTDACLTTCAAASCGDGVVHDGVELCDDGNVDDTDACLSTCTVASCGDGFVAAGVEDCDDANADDTDACLATCVAASCGDGFLMAGVEACDDGNADDTDACLVTCELASCGDGEVQAGVEACDDGNTEDGDGCDAACVVEQACEGDECEPTDDDGGGCCSAGGTRGGDLAGVGLLVLAVVLPLRRRKPARR
jgi:cysteine-rich repeat protein